MKLWTWTLFNWRQCVFNMNYTFKINSLRLVYVQYALWACFFPLVSSSYTWSEREDKFKTHNSNKKWDLRHLHNRSDSTPSLCTIAIPVRITLFSQWVYNKPRVANKRPMHGDKRTNTYVKRVVKQHRLISHASKLDYLYLFLAWFFLSFFSSRFLFKCVSLCFGFSHCFVRCCLTWKKKTIYM